MHTTMKKPLVKPAQPLTPAQQLAIKGGNGSTPPPLPPPEIVIDDIIQN
jgi:hypothetical protein